MRSLGLVKAIRLTGTQASLAKALQAVAPTIKQQHISYWLQHGIPIRRARQIVDVVPESGPVANFFTEVDAADDDEFEGAHVVGSCEQDFSSAKKTSES